ncbi:MAG: HIT family protein [Flavobacteriales bacterium]|nr:HIT family protein [Flavobacteriales bacterium]
MSTIFTKIVKGEIPSYKIAENDRFFAFLDINPIVYGHVLVIPKREVDYIFDLSDEHFVELFKYSKKIAIAMKKVIKCKRIGVSVIGLEVPHAHIHLIPLNTVSDINFDVKRLSFSEIEMNEIAKKISSFL